MSKLANSLITMATAVLLTACSQNTQTLNPPVIPPELGRSSAVSVSLPGFIIHENTVMRWYSDLVWVDEAGGTVSTDRAATLQAALQAELENKGIRFVEAGAPANYDVLALALVGEGSGMEAVKELFSLYPSLAASSSSYDKGTVMVAIAPAGIKKAVWRGALKVFTTGETLDPEIAQARLKWGAQRLLESIPAHH